MIADRIHKDHCHGQSMIQYCLKTQTRFLAVAQKCYPLISKSAMSTCWLWNMYPWSCVWLFSYKMYWVIIEQSKLELWCVPRKIPQGCPVQFTLIWSWWGEQTWIVLNIQCVFWNARFSFLAHPSCTSFDVNSINSRCLSVQIKTKWVTKKTMQEMPDTKDCEMWVNGCPLGISVPWCFLKSKWCLIMFFFRSLHHPLTVETSSNSFSIR